jgi:hypothetical protein
VTPSTKFIIYGLQLLLVLAAVLVGHLFYLSLTVPRLPDLQVVPLVWWLIMYAPTLFVCVMLSMRAERIGQVILVAVMAGLTQAGTNYIFFLLKQPGHIKEPVSVAAAFVGWASLYLIVCCAGFGARKLMTKGIDSQVS